MNSRVLLSGDRDGFLVCPCGNFGTPKDVRYPDEITALPKSRHQAETTSLDQLLISPPVWAFAGTSETSPPPESFRLSPQTLLGIRTPKDAPGFHVRMTFIVSMTAGPRLPSSWPRAVSPPPVLFIHYPNDKEPFKLHVTFPS